MTSPELSPDDASPGPFHGRSRASLILRIGVLEDQLAYERQRNNRLEQKMYQVRKSRYEYMAMASDLREENEMLRTMLDMEDEGASSIDGEVDLS